MKLKDITLEFKSDDKFWNRLYDTTYIFCNGLFHRNYQEVSISDRYNPCYYINGVDP